VLRELSYAFESLTTIEPVILNQESNPQFAQVASATDMTVVISYDLRIGGEEGEATLCIPFASLQSVLDQLTGNGLMAGQAESDPVAVERALTGRLDETAVDVSVRFNEVVLPSAEIVDLRPGDVLPLAHHVDKPLTVTVAGVPRLAGVAGRRGKRLACLIVDAPTTSSEDRS
jgi:flagellar motor switch protein FliM